MGARRRSSHAGPSTCGGARWYDAPSPRTPMRISSAPSVPRPVRRFPATSRSPTAWRSWGRLAHGADAASTNFSTADDCASTLRCLAGARRRRPRARGPHRRRSRAAGRESLQARRGPARRGNSGSTLRMLAGVAGRPALPHRRSPATRRCCRRPVERVAAPLRAMGARAAVDRRQAAPDHRRRRRCAASRWDLPVASAQVKTAVLLAGLAGRRAAPPSREPAPSRDHTERLLPAFGVPVEREGPAVSVERRGPPAPVAASTCPGDVSSAAFLVVAAPRPARTREVRIEDVLLNPRRIGVPRRAAGDGRATSRSASTRRSRSRWAGSWPARRACTGSTSRRRVVPGADRRGAGPRRGRGLRRRASSRCRGAAELRVKESDRIAALAEGLRAHGRRRSRSDPDGLAVDGGAPLHGRAGARPRRPPHRHGPGRGRRWRRDGRDRDRGRRLRRGVLPRVLRRAGARAAERRAPEPPARIVLVGFMGAGKSTVGPRLAARSWAGASSTWTTRIEERAGRTDRRDLRAAGRGGVPRARSGASRASCAGDAGAWSPPAAAPSRTPRRARPCGAARSPSGCAADLEALARARPRRRQPAPGRRIVR